MPIKPKPHLTPAGLRRLAEKDSASRRLKTPVPRPQIDPQRLLHELEVHQIELEMQNAELRLARDEADLVREQYADLYDFAPVGYFTLRADGTIHMVNLAGAALVGMVRSRLVGRSFERLVSPARRPAFNTFLEQVFARNAAPSIESELIHQGHPDRCVTINVQLSPDGQECNMNVTDISERKLTEDILRRNEALFSALIGQVPIGVYVVDAGFHLQQANPLALRAFGNIDHPIGRDFAEIVRFLWPKRVAEDTLTHFRHTLKTGEPYRTPDFTHRRRDIGVTEFYEWQIERITLPPGDFGVVCFFNDITARIQAEKAQRDIEVMTASNLKLKQEIVRRQAVEEALNQTRAEETRLLHQSRQQGLRLRDLSHQILNVQEAERKRISRELHDVITQTLVGINVHVSALALETNDELGSIQKRFTSTLRMVEKSVKTIHQFAQELRPTSLDDLGLIPALQTRLRTFMEETGIRVSLKAFAGIENAPEIVRTAFYRIAQEALANVAKHANASAVEILIQSLGDSISMEISDNGQGFDVHNDQPSKEKSHLGLIGMRERAEMIGGDFSVASAPGAPTTIRIVVKAPRTRKKSVK